MAIRNIRQIGDSVLNKPCKEVKEINDRTRDLISDMFDTMYEADGVGLAAPQVGILKKIFVVDVTGEEPLLFVNPEILETDGEQTGYEGCLSVEGKSGLVTRPNHVKVKAYDINMNEFTMEAEGFLARAILHENDHLNGVLYVDKVEGPLLTNEELARMMEEQENQEKSE